MAGLDTRNRFHSHKIIALFFCLVLVPTSGCRGKLDTISTSTPTQALVTNTLASLPDLLAGSVSAQVQPPDDCPSENGTYQFAVQIINQGSAFAGPFVVRFNQLHQEVSQGLLPGDSISVFFIGKTLLPTIEVDSENRVYESDETNNRWEAEIIPPTPTPHCLRTPTPEVELVDPIAVLQGHTAKVSVVDFSPDGDLIASGSVDNTLRLWRTNEGTLLRTMQGHPFPVLQLAFSPDGSLLATGSTDGIIRLWRVSNSQLIKNLQGHAGWITSLGYSADGNNLLSSAQDFTVRIWRASDSRLVQTIDEGMSIVNQAVFSPTGTELAWGEADGTVRVRSLGGSWIHVFHPNVEQATSVAYSPDAGMLAAGFENGTILIWSMPGGTLFQTIEAHGSEISQLDFSPDGHWLAAGSYDGLISLWWKGEIDTPFQIHLIYEGHEGAVNGIAFSPDGKLIASGGDDATVRLWPVPEE